MRSKEKPPKAALIESIRSIGYNFNSALADIIDNSISAKAKNVQINLVSHIPAIVIIDDGEGMSPEQLDNAMDLGSKSPNEDRNALDLGRFGLGLKSASFSQCRKLTVTSLKKGSLSSMTWDLGIVEKQDKWVILENDQKHINDLPYAESLKKSRHGTIVMWEEFDRIKNSSGDLANALQKLLNEAYEYLALVFHKFVSANQIKISICGNELVKKDPFLLNRTDTQKFKEELLPVKNSKGETYQVAVKTYILPFSKNISVEERKLMGVNEDMRNQQGFYVYRSNRLIIWGTWLHMVGMNELYKNARVEVNIPNTLDDIWEVDIKKASATIPGVIRIPLMAHVKKAIEGSARVYKKRGENQSKEKGYQTIWNVSEERDTYDITINKNNPLIIQLKSELNDEQTVMFNTLIRDIESNLPKMKIYTQVAGTKKDSGVQTSDEIEQSVRQILESMNERTSEEKLSFLGMLFQTEPYSLEETLYEKLAEELKNDKQ